MNFLIIPKNDLIISKIRSALFERKCGYDSQSLKKEIENREHLKQYT